MSAVVLVVAQDDGGRRGVRKTETKGRDSTDPCRREDALHINRDKKALEGVCAPRGVTHDHLVRDPCCLAALLFAYVCLFRPKNK